MMKRLIASDLGERKQLERIRAKGNRDRFRRLIEMLNEYIYDGKLDTNRCLSMAISTLRLHTYIEDSNNIKEITKLRLPEADLHSSVVKSGDDSPSSSQSAPDFLLGSSFSLDNYSIDLLFGIWNVTGIGFDTNGTILYTSKNFIEKLGLTVPIEGQNITCFLCHGAGDVLDRVFKKKIMRWVGYIEVVKPTQTDTITVLWNGKIITSPQGEEMYLGYMELKDALYFNPGGIFWNKEIIANSDFILLKRNHYMDQLLGWEETNPDSFTHVHPQDILALSNLNDELTTKGYSERTFRFLCHSESKEVRWLLVLTKIYPFINQHGEFILVSYAWPFGYARDQLGSFEQNQDTMDNLQFIKTHEGWLSLVPSFFRELANQPSRNSTEQSNSQPTYPHPGNPPRPPGHPRSI